MPNQLQLFTFWPKTFVKGNSYLSYDYRGAKSSNFTFPNLAITVKLYSLFTVCLSRKKIE